MIQWINLTGINQTVINISIPWTCACIMRVIWIIYCLLPLLGGLLFEERMLHANYYCFNWILHDVVSSYHNQTMELFTCILHVMRFMFGSPNWQVSNLLCNTITRQGWNKWQWTWWHCHSKGIGNIYNAHSINLQDEALQLLQLMSIMMQLY